MGGASDVFQCYHCRNTFAVIRLDMIQSFRCKHTRSLFEGGNPRRFIAFKDVSIRKLTQLPKFRPNKRQAALGKKAESIAKIGKVMNA
jgi:hypothetical protein